jgi:mono/diheme cytochrome c family protein
MKTEIAAAAVIGIATIGALWSWPGGRAAYGQEPAESRGQPRSIWDGVYTEEQAKRGDEPYHSQCASCHGQTLGGGEAAPPLAGGEFLSSWNGLTLGDLFERIRISMPQDHPGKLSREQNAEILSYILSVNKFPSGKKELPRQTELLKEIRFEANKPDVKQ